ncbi:MAG: glycosyltransferase family 9 protein [Phycisphaerales bacterium]
MPRREPSRILLIRPSALGDVCRTVPVLAALLRAFPKAEIDWLVQDTFQDAIWHHPGLSHTIPFARHELGRALRRGKPGPLLGFIRRLRRAQYDMVVDAQGLFRSGFFAWTTGARTRVGHADARELGWLGVNLRARARKDAHTVERMLSLLPPIGAEAVADMRLYTGPKERSWVEALWPSARARPANAGAGGLAVLAPTSRWHAKRWPADRFASLAKSMLSRGFAGVAVVGGASERDQCRPLLDLAARESRVLDLVGKTSVGQLMALVQAGSLVVANDSAVIHMAIGFDRPAVALYGPTSIARVGPYVGPRQPAAAARTIVLQHIRPGERLDHKSPDTRQIERISLDEVLSASGEVLSPGVPAGAR